MVSEEVGKKNVLLGETAIEDLLQSSVGQNISEK